jgi:hypothetical protein
MCTLRRRCEVKLDYFIVSVSTGMSVKILLSLFGESDLFSLAILRVCIHSCVVGLVQMCQNMFEGVPSTGSDVGRYFLMRNLLDNNL